MCHTDNDTGLRGGLTGLFITMAKSAKCTLLKNYRTLHLSITNVDTFYFEKLHDLSMLTSQNQY